MSDIRLPRRFPDRKNAILFYSGRIVTPMIYLVPMVRDSAACNWLALLNVILPDHAQIPAAYYRQYLTEYLQFVLSKGR